LNTMKKSKYGIPVDKLPIFEEIIQRYDGNELEAKFLKAMEENLTNEQRFRIFEQNGSCQGKKYDKERMAFAAEHADKPLAERLKIFTEKHGRKAVLNDDGTIKVTFACSHGYYKHAPKGKFHVPESVETYFERCAGGLMYEFQKALGVKLKIKSVDVSPLGENIVNPVVFTFEKED
ncbi:MAG: hypothetical protein FWG36_07795, partial [Oscillospiraceae bacterium]|nr:hypothetical protein [Oscillospiraceae bacterium]